MMPGTTVLERYVVERPLGEGGMGAVYQARHVALGHQVALKVMTIVHPEASRRFLVEARAMAAVRSPYVASVIDYGTHEDSPVLLMEFIDGESLEARLSQVGALTWDYAFRLASEVAEGLAAIHAASLLHRDIKPANIMLERGRRERAKIVDFGIAKQLGPESPKLTKTGMIIGTPAYMPPEQMLGAELSPASDLYALGVTLWEMVSGGAPFGSEYTDALRRIAEPPPPPVIPSDLPQLPDAAKSLMETLLQNDPEQRCSSADRLSRQLLELATGERSKPVEPSAAATQLDPNSEGAKPQGPVLAVARVPTHVLDDRSEQIWLSSQVPAGSRSYTLGALWFSLVAGSESAEQLEQRLRVAFEQRYGAVVSVRVRQSPKAFRLSPSALAGAGQLPEFLAEMLALV